VKKPCEALREGWQEGLIAAGMSGWAVMFLQLVRYAATLVCPSASWMNGSHTCTTSGSVTGLATTLQSGDPLAVLMHGVSSVILAPIWEELFFR
jgi:membrane protease YdiL (CAAX protease family)